MAGAHVLPISRLLDAVARSPGLANDAVVDDDSARAGARAFIEDRAGAFLG